MNHTLRILLFASAFAAIGCGKSSTDSSASAPATPAIQVPFIDPILQRFDNALTEIQKSREAIQAEIQRSLIESSKWRETLITLEESLASDVKEIIRSDLAYLVNYSAEAAGNEFRCNLDFLEAKVLTHLDSVKTAIEKQRADYVKTKKINRPIETLIGEIVAGVGHLPPHICRTRVSEAGEIDKLTFLVGQGRPMEAIRSTVEFVGFALKRPSDESEQYLGTLVSRDGQERPVSGFAKMVAANPYSLIVRADQLADVNEKDSILRVKWGNDVLYEVVILTKQREPEKIIEWTDGRILESSETAKISGPVCGDGGVVTCRVAIVARSNPHRFDVEVYGKCENHCLTDNLLPWTAISILRGDGTVLKRVEVTIPETGARGAFWNAPVVRDKEESGSIRETLDVDKIKFEFRNLAHGGIAERIVAVDRKKVELAPD